MIKNILSTGSLYLISITIFSALSYYPYKEDIVFASSGFLFQIVSSFVLISLFFLLASSLGKWLGSSSKILKYSMGILFFCLQLIVLFINLLVFASKQEWGYPANYEMALEAMPHSWSLIQNLPAHYNAPLYLAILAIVSILLLIFSIRFIDKIINSNIDSKSWITIGLGILVSIGIFYSSKERISKVDPIVSFFNKTQYSYFTGTTSKLGFESLASTLEKVDNFDKKNVILVTIDCLRADHLDFNGYFRATTPYLSALYETGKMQNIKTATSSCSISWCGILSTLFSKSVNNLQVFNYGLHDYLSLQGYLNNFILSGMHSSFLDLKSAYGDDVNFYREGKNYESFNFNDDRVLIEGVKELESFKGDPSFFYIHMMGPHQVGVKLPEYSKYHPTRPDGLFLMDQFDGYKGLSKYRKLAINHYDNGLYQSDQILKTLMEGLERKGYLEDYILVVLGDHGESFAEHNASFIHGRGLWQNYIGIPILIYDPNDTKKCNTTYGSQIDIAPTIANRLGLPVPKQWEGISLYDTISQRTTYHEQKIPGEGDKKHYAVIEKDAETLTKYIYNEVDEIEEVYDLVNDQDELVNIIEGLPEENINNFRKKLNSFHDRTIVGELADLQQLGSDSFDIAAQEIIDLPDFCYILDEEHIKSYFNISSDVIQLHNITPNKKSCQCTSSWTSGNNKSRTISLQAKDQIPKFVIDFFRKNGFRKKNNIRDKKEFYQFEDLDPETLGGPAIWSEEGKVLVWGAPNKFSYVLEDFNKDDPESQETLFSLAAYINNKSQ